MKNKISFLIKYFLFWIIFAVVHRAIFVVYFIKKTKGFGFYEFFMLFYKGLALDASLTGYIVFIAILALICLLVCNQTINKIFLKIYTLFFLLLCSTIYFADIQAFAVWNYHLDASVVDYVKIPKEALGSAPLSTLIYSICAVITMVAIFYYIFCKFLVAKLTLQTNLKTNLKQIPVLFFIAALMIIPIRGSFDVSPMKISFAFFSGKYPFANQAAINPVWNFCFELLHRLEDSRQTQFNFMPQEKADLILSRYFDKSKSANTTNILKVEKPNIVIILLESFTANAVGVLNGNKFNATPNLDKIAKEGLLFTNIYSTGSRSDKGVAGTLTATPAHPIVPILSIGNKASNLKAFSKNLATIGYETSFYYAGDINFFNFNILSTSNFHHVYSREHFPAKAKEYQSKWGILDEYLFEQLYKDMMQPTKSPQMIFAFTLSSHEPFDVFGRKIINGNSTQDLFLNSVAYTDEQLGKFIDKIKKTKVWDNTLFVFLADHGVRYIEDPDAPNSFYYHIPIIFAGGALNVTAQTNSKIGSQLDLAATLLAQLNLDHSEYKYSNNLLAKNKPEVAFFANPDLVGIITPEGETNYRFRNEEFINQDDLKHNQEAIKAYLQTLDAEQLK